MNAVRGVSGSPSTERCGKEARVDRFQSTAFQTGPHIAVCTRPGGAGTMNICTLREESTRTGSRRGQCRHLNIIQTCTTADTSWGHTHCMSLGIFYWSITCGNTYTYEAWGTEIRIQVVVHSNTFFGRRHCCMGSWVSFCTRSTAVIVQSMAVILCCLPCCCVLEMQRKPDRLWRTAYRCRFRKRRSIRSW